MNYVYTIRIQRGRNVFECEVCFTSVLIVDLSLNKLTRAVNNVLFTECGERLMSQGPGSLQSSNGTECIAGSTLTLSPQTHRVSF